MHAHVCIDVFNVTYMHIVLVLRCSCVTLKVILAGVGKGRRACQLSIYTYALLMLGLCVHVCALVCIVPPDTHLH